MSARPWMLEETTWPAVRSGDLQVAVLPWGATEAHNLHLPFGTDTHQSVAIAAEAARLAWEQGRGVLVLPAIPFGANAQQLDIRGTINLNPSTQSVILADVIESLELHKIPKLVICNGHGGNDFKAIIREAQAGTEIFLSVVNWFAVPGTHDGFEEPGDHAGELETSLMLHLREDLVRPLAEAGSGAARPWRLSAIREGWAWAPRRWSQVTEDTGVGDPSAATAEKGREFFAQVTRRIAAYLQEVADCDPADLYG